MAETGSQRSCPYDDANIFSKLTFWWMNALFRLGFKNQLTSVNICDVSKEDKSSGLEAKLDRCWKEELDKFSSSEGHAASLFVAVLKAFKWQLIFPGALIFFLEVTKLIQPYLIGRLVSYFNDDDGAVDSGTAYGIGAGLGLTAVLQAILNPTYFFIMQHVAMRMKVAVGALIYKKVLSLSAEAFAYTSAGQIVNHLSTDIEKFNSSIDLLHHLWVSPLSIAVTMYLVYRQVGSVCFWGFGVILLIIPIQSALAASFGHLRFRIGAISDQRIQVLTEAVSSMKFIKMQCWEQLFQKLISDLRRSEGTPLRWSYLVHAVETSLETMTPGLAILAVLVALWMEGQGPEPVQVFTMMLWMYVAHSAMLKFPYQPVRGILRLRKSAQVVQAFLLLDEEKEHIKDLRLHRSVSFRNEPHNDWAVDIDHMTARWPLVYTEGRRRFQKKRQRSSTSSMKSLLHESDVDHAFSLKYISLQVKKGELVVIVGMVGSGKSSLLLSLIEELPHEIGQIAINGRVSYCGQTNWVFSGTVHDNIVFGHQFNRTRYQRVIEACGLTHDLELMPKGDMTYVGEHGLRLSGGQKARISLARCVYHDADVFLLDDPLSAVDTTVGAHIFKRCILDLLRNKTVILVTHQIHYLKQADRIVVLRDGSIHDVGTYDELKAGGMDMRALTTMEHPKHATDAKIEAEEEEAQILLESKSLDTLTYEDGDEEGELVRTGSVRLRVYWDYFAAGFGPALLLILIPTWLAAPALFCLSDWMLAKWVGGMQHMQSSPDPSPLPVSASVGPAVPQDESQDWASMPWNLQMYIIAFLASFGSFLLCGVVYLQMTATASRRLHDRMLHSVLNSVSRFFDTRPIGQILNRFSRDLLIIDDMVSVYGFVVSKKTFHLLSFFVLTVVINPWLAIALVPIMVVLLLTRMYAVRTLRQVKRLEARARSPVYSHVSDTVRGLETIRALKKKDQVLAEFGDLQDKHTAAWFLYLSSYRWMSVRTLCLVVLYMLVVIFVSVALKNSLDGNLLGLSLVYCLAMMEPFEFYIRASAELETYMTSVERVLDYCSLEQEPPKTSVKPPPPDWPNRGAITFTKTSLKYSDKAPLILQDIECHIKGKEKIGIVGRTGSGKSSLISALFHLAKPVGAIYIDGVDTNKLGLHELRSQMSIIPQDPVLYSGTLRWNLDPAYEFSDERLWSALEQVQLKGKVNQLPGQLYAEVQEGGVNLSVGQRQLVCLARAILKHKRILVLDEATANVDQETDDIIQRTIRAKFRESTVLTIAHRLYTVMDCDRLMVLEKGELKEMDTPHNLLQDPDGVFTRLVLSTGKSQAKQLQALAELSQHQRASASLQLQRAMLLANEQLAQSTEDLSAGRALNWNRFTHSQGSLDKTFLESVPEKEKKSVGPSQRIIRRRSPGRTKRTVEEEEELLSYDAPPKVHTRISPLARDTTPVDHSVNGTGRISEGSGSGAENSPQQERAVFQSRGAGESHGQKQSPPQMRRKSDRGRREIVETDIDFPSDPPSPAVVPTHRRQPSQSAISVTNHETRPMQGRLGKRHPTSREPHSPKKDSSGLRVLSGPYIPRPHKDEEKEQFV
ncbi:multidrug resistance-associated protein 4 isoform X2 [Aplysia californica]|uniref:Multidrug resistance-associated protein 4 isoform X2 n=1 Tax=Aplysia californica TaxID=6500 RepID=A0ABM1VQI4_APLCA|nr:multidrug resistance-associated protein 4 isoform X2 [Aplysia californica]